MQPSFRECFCWSRFGTEAGETIDRILERKERERLQNGGTFLWGIGSAIGPSIRELLRLESTPEVLFSPISSRPKLVDVAPPATVVWTAGCDLEGRPVPLPRWSRVTSRVPSASRPSRHYALVCYSEVSLRLDPNPRFIRMGQLRNLRTNSRVGASQVTAVVRYTNDPFAEGPAYAVAMRVRLVPPFLVTLAHPLVDSQLLATRAS